MKRAQRNKPTNRNKKPTSRIKKPTNNRKKTNEWGEETYTYTDRYALFFIYTTSFVDNANPYSVKV
jgi:hypothetical protein